MLNLKELILSVIISIFSVIFLWWFWNNWIHALWFNASVFWLLFFAYFLVWIKDYKRFIHKNFYWITPIIFMILSFSVYENPYYKEINTLLLPVLITIFFWYSLSEIKWSNIWNTKMIWKIVSRKLFYGKTFKVLNDSINKGSISQVIIKKVVIWIFIFLIINSIIVGLLMWADSEFWKIISDLFKYINSTTLLKIFVSFLILILLTNFKVSWQDKHVIDNTSKEKQIDSIISWIVLGWTLITYLLFIWVQIDSVLASKLPTNVNEVVSLVKSWFWQLFFISIINIVFFFIYYKKTTGLVQKILIAFIFASIIILVSAWNRMFLYVYNYWFSYEKFTASYTVLYFWILFLIMISLLFLKSRVDILKTWVILALWMYWFLNVIPTEMIIFKTNLLVSDRENSRIYPYQSHMLSVDILNSVRNIKWTDIYKKQSWESWINKKEKEMNKKKWYEKNIHNF